MNHVGLFSGIGGFEEAFRRAGASCLAVCEIEPQAQSVLRRHFPNAEVISDVQTITKDSFAGRSIDVLTGGFPCQDLSVAGRRAGLAGKRSGLWFEFVRIIGDHKPRWVVIENVPGLLSGCGCYSCQTVGRLISTHSRIRRRKGGKTCAVCIAGKRMLESHSGRNLAIILHGLVELGYGVAYRILDSQFDGVAQRRRRVFIVASLGSGRCAEVLFEREGSAWDSPPSREAGERTADSLTVGANQTCGFPGDVTEHRITGFGDGIDLARCVTTGGAKRQDYETCTMIASYGLIGNAEYADRPAALRAKGGDCGGGSEHLIAHTLRAGGHDASEDGTGRGTPLVVGTLNSGGNNGGFRTEPGEHLVCVRDVAQSLTSNYGKQPDNSDTALGPNLVCAFTERTRADGRNFEAQEELAYALTNPGSGGRTHSRQIAGGFGVRRLTPTECERLQGFEDGWTAYGHDGKPMSDSARYRMLGNAVCVPTVEWIARRIAAMESPLRT